MSLGPCAVVHKLLHNSASVRIISNMSRGEQTRPLERESSKPLGSLNYIPSTGPSSSERQDCVSWYEIGRIHSWCKSHGSGIRWFGCLHSWTYKNRSPKNSGQFSFTAAPLGINVTEPTCLVTILVTGNCTYEEIKRPITCWYSVQNLSGRLIAKDVLIYTELWFCLLFCMVVVLETAFR
jgi:hypothetical protein